MATKKNIVSGVLYDPTGVPTGYTDLYRNFGDPDAPDFEDKYLVSVTHEFGGKPVTFKCHKAMAWRLHLVWAKLAAIGKLNLLKTFDGCHVNRPVRGGTQKSLHAFGLALDINAADFPLGSSKRQDHDVIVAFESQGFWYGGDFHNRPDPMHFQWAADF